MTPEEWKRLYSIMGISTRTPDPQVQAKPTFVPETTPTKMEGHLPRAQFDWFGDVGPLAPGQKRIRDPRVFMPGKTISPEMEPLLPGFLLPEAEKPSPNAYRITMDEALVLDSMDMLRDPVTNQPRYPIPPGYTQEKARMGAMDALGLGTLPETIAGMIQHGYSEIAPGEQEFEKKRDMYRDAGHGWLKSSYLAEQAVDLPSVRVPVLPFSIPLPGGRSFQHVDLGVKGFLENVVGDPFLYVAAPAKIVSGGAKITSLAARKSVQLARKETLDSVFNGTVIRGLKESDVNKWMNGKRIMYVEETVNRYDPTKPRFQTAELQQAHELASAAERASLDKLVEAGLYRKVNDFMYEQVVDAGSDQGREILTKFRNHIAPSPESVGNTRVSPVRELANVVDEVVTIENPIVRVVAEKLGINPSAAASSDVAKAVIGHARQMISADELIELTLISNLDVLAKRGQVPFMKGMPVDIDAQGFVKGTGKLWNDVFSEPARYADNLSVEARAYIDNFNSIVDEMELLRVNSGLGSLGKSTKDGWLYVPRQVRGKDGIEFRRPSNPKLQRSYDEATEGFENGVRYDIDPRGTLQMHMKASYREIVEKQLSDYLEPLSIRPSQLIDENLRTAMTVAVRKKITAERNLRRLRNRMRVLQVGRTAEPGPGVRRAEAVVRTARANERKTLQAQIKDAQKLLTHDVMVEYDAVKARWKKALERVQKAGSGPGELFGRADETIAIKQWNNRFFALEDVKILTNALNTFGYTSKDMGAVSRNFTKLANTTRFLASVGDFAAPFIQGLPLLVTNPVQWGKAAGNHYWAWFDPTVQARFVAKNVDTLQEMARYGVPVGDNEFFAALKAGEGFSPGKMLEHLPAGATARQVMRGAQKQTFGRFQSSYNTFLTMSRTMMWDTMKDSWTARGGTRAELGAYVRNLTGGLDSRALGVGPKQRAGESVWLAFSPKLLRSTIAVVSDAVRAIGPETAFQARGAARAVTGRGPMARGTAGATVRQRESLKLMGRMISGIGGTYVAAGIMMGKSEDEIMEGLNPLNGGRFLSYEIGGQWIGVGGQFRALTQFMVHMTSAIAPGGEEISTLGSRSILENPILKALSYRGAPGVNIVGGGVELVTGADALPFDNIDTVPDLFQHIGTSALPFVVQGMLEGDNAIAAGFGGAGLRTRTLSPADDVRMLRKEQLELRGIDLDWTDSNLDLRIKHEIDDLPEIKAALEERNQYFTDRGSDYQAIKNEDTQIDDDFTETIDTRYGALGPGKEFRAELRKEYLVRATRKEALRARDDYKEATEFLEEKDASTYGFNHALDAYADALFDPELEDELTGEYRYDERERRLNNLREQFGPTVIDEVRDYFRRNNPQGIKDFNNEMQIMRPYFEISEQQAEKYGYGELWRRYMEIEHNQRYQFARDNPEIKFVEKQIRKEKDRFLMENVLAAGYLWKWEYLESDKPINPTLRLFISDISTKQGNTHGIISDRSDIDSYLEHLKPEWMRER